VVVVWDGVWYVSMYSTSEYKISVGWCCESATVYEGVWLVSW
jgi:hypothetical protein